MRTISGPNHYLWKGADAQPDAGRNRARRHFDLTGETCQHDGCEKPAVDRHHVDDDTTNNAPSNIRFLCRHHHMLEDGRLDELQRVARVNLDRGIPRPPLKTHCPQGHAYDETNTRINARGARECRECRREQSHRSHVKRTALAVAVLALLLVGAPSALGGAAKPKTCKTIGCLRSAIAWNHGVLNATNARIAIANGRAGGGRSTPKCHTLSGCAHLLSSQKHSRIWSQGTWGHIRHDNTPAGAMRVVRYLFAPCGRVAQIRAHLIVGWESGWKRFEINGAGDTSWWQIEKGSDSPPGHGWDPHPDVAVEQAEDAWQSTEIAVRWSKCGRDFSPIWTSVRDHGRDWA